MPRSPTLVRDRFRPARPIAGLMGWLAVTFYVAQHARLGPNHVDGGLLLGYIQTIADGGRPYFDFVDLYGLAHWPLPALFYVAAGQKVWGLRLWLVVIKLVSLGLSYRLVRRLASARAAWGAVVLLSLLLGLPWQLLQTTYAFMPALALELGVLLLVLRRPAPGPKALILAGVLTGIALCTKLNSGAFLWAGLMFICMYFPALVPAQPRGQPEPPVRAPQRRAVRGVQGLGLLAYAVVFHLFIREHYNGLYALYLTVPLLLLLAWVATHLPEPRLFGSHLRAWAIAAVVPPVTGVGLLAVYLGEALPAYVRDMRDILAHLDYVSPIPPIGRPGHYVGFNESLWPQFPWLVSVVFGLWWWVSERSSGARRSLLPPLFAVYVCNLFVMYSRTDESHLHQAMLLGTVVLPVTWSDGMGRVAPRIAPRLWIVAVAFLAFACATLGTRPHLDLFTAGRGDWGSPRLVGLLYARDPNPYIRRFRPQLDARAWDRNTDMAARYINRYTRDGQEVLVLARNELLNFASHTTPGGGRERYLWYLFRNGHFTRRDLQMVGPPDLLRRWVSEPPAMIVRAWGDRQIEDTFPEITQFIDRHYRKARNFRHLTVLVHRGHRMSDAAEPAR